MTTMAPEAPVKTRKYSVEFLRNDGRDELSKTDKLPEEWARSFAYDDLKAVMGLDDEEAAQILDDLFKEFNENEAVMARKDFPKTGEALIIEVVE